MGSHIVAGGGGGFSSSPHFAPTALDRFLVELSGKSSPLVCFAPTASADDANYINHFLVAYSTLGVRTMVLTLWADARHSVERLAEADVVVVGGGSTVNLLSLWQAHGVADRLRERHQAGDVVLGGISAGGACWFEGCVTDSFGDLAVWHGGLGLAKGTFCPHFDTEEGRAPFYTEAVGKGALGAGFAADDGAAIHFADGQLAGFVSERPAARVYRLSASDEPGAGGVLVEPQEVTQI